MSAFDKSFSRPSGCFAICNEKGESQSHPQQDRPDGRLLLTNASGDSQKLQEIDDMLSNAMKALTFEEQQEQLEIIHGVGRIRRVADEETFVETSFQQLESHLAQIKSGSMYEMAEQMDRVYVRSRAFRLMFLRGNRYDIKDTAENMLRFFEMKRQLFGVRKLVKDITLEDLDEDDIAAMNCGFFQLAGKDSAGRVIVANFPGLRGRMTLQSELRMRYYILMSALKKEENQLCGFVSIVFSVGDMHDRFGGSGFFENAKLSLAIPKYTAAVHLCTDEIGEYLFQVSIVKACTLKLRSRIRLNFGSQTECLYQLSTYGISQDFLPLDPNTQQTCSMRHRQWVDSRFAIEKHVRPLPTITSTPTKEQTSNIIAGDADVLIGTGKKSNNMGNERLRALVKDFSQAYNDGTKEERKSLVDLVIHSVQESGGRFLKEHDRDGRNVVVWKEMTMGLSRRNVTQAFRNSYRRRKTSDGRVQKNRGPVPTVLHERDYHYKEESNEPDECLSDNTIIEWDGVGTLDGGNSVGARVDEGASRVVDVSWREISNWMDAAGPANLEAVQWPSVAIRPK